MLRDVCEYIVDCIRGENYEEIYADGIGNVNNVIFC